MTKLSQLEIEALEKLVNGILEIEQSAIHNSDSVNDFVFDTFKVETQEQAVLNVVRKHHNLVGDNIDELSTLGTKLLAHFKGE